MPNRWVAGGIWAVLMSAGILAYTQSAEAEQQPEPAKIRISDVIITGNQRISTEQIKDLIRIRPGKEYNPAVVDDDVRELYKTNQFSNITTFLQENGIDKVKIYFSVREMPNVVQKITFLGAKHIKIDELQEITGVRPGMALDPDLNRQGCERIIEKYAEMGRSFADCQLLKGGELADTEVVYQITEGYKVKVRDIQFTGNTFVNSARLLTHLKSFGKWCSLPGGTYNKQMAESDVGEINKFFRSHGYQDVKVSLETKRSADGREVRLIFHIQEGPRYKLQDTPEIHGSRYRNE